MLKEKPNWRFLGFRLGVSQFLSPQTDGQTLYGHMWLNGNLFWPGMYDINFLPVSNMPILSKHLIPDFDINQ